ncbi:hypothetical protein LDJ81_00145 [Lentilactobacillus parabuchneri]|uniref:hypothetical protein n=1 Tax=Lentilactobacillus parabuchneri TaxID=152331 RepID=UPI0022360AEB|nr:hypothetical protein [Lentilactobacillus parabuchneri]MCW4397441.1 hypothetical protein [Lentilactobacillus parabuchneri]
MEKEYYVFYNEVSHAYIKQMNLRLVSGKIDYSETEDPNKALPLLTTMSQAIVMAKKCALKLDIPDDLIVVKKATKKAVAYSEQQKLLSNLHEALVSCMFQGDSATKRAVSLVISDFSNYAGIELEQSDDWD